MAKTVLIVDDDALLRRSLVFHLEQEGFRTHNAANAEDALAVARRERPDVVLLDVGLPGMDGLEALRHFREEVGVPVIFVTARRRGLDEVLGLELGAEDYITKPFDPDVLVARVRRTLRHAATTPVAVQEQLEVGDLVIDLAARTVTRGGEPIELTARLFALLATLAQVPNRVFSLDELLDRVWGADYPGEPQVVYVHVRWLRERLEEDPQHPRRVLTVRGVGYKLVPQPGT